MDDYETFRRMLDAAGSACNGQENGGKNPHGKGQDGRIQGNYDEVDLGG
jgi:hypothetical protein